MKLKNIFVGFLKTLLLITLFCGSLIHATNYMFLILQNYQYTANDFPPYLFEKNFETGQLTKIIDTENAFQFKTYSLASETDIESLDHYNRFFPSFPNPDQGNIYLL
jgi:hypothetical protein